MSTSSLPCETVQSLDPADVILVDPERLGGTPVFRSTRVPIKTLFDYLRAGDPIDTFLDHFPGVQREQVETVIELAGQGLLSEFMHK